MQKSGTGNKNFCQMERDISNQPKCQISASIPSEHSSQTNQTETVHSIWLYKKNSRI